jgi:LmbE family N-acetylglucosaminyl deacetylase
MRRVVVVAPHPDDETFGAGGSLLRWKAEAHEIHWIVVTRMDATVGYSEAAIAERDALIQKVAAAYGFDSVSQLRFAATTLDRVSLGEVIDELATVFRRVEPSDVLMPYPHDVHTDHQAVCRAVTACSKWFRFPHVRRLLAYETVSETDFALPLSQPTFSPNLFVNIEGQLPRKLEIVRLYAAELGAFPFPRSPEVVEAQAKLRGAQCGARSAEAFVCLKEIV